jgi:hypothetical protein
LWVRPGYYHSEKRLTFGEAQQIIVCVHVDAHNLCFAADKLRKVFLAEFVHINSAFSGANAVRARFSEMPRPQKQTQAASIARRGRTVEFAAA